MFAVEATKPPLEEFEDVKQQMEKFSLQFNALVLERKSSILTSKQQHVTKVNELERRALTLREEIETCRVKKDKTADIINLTLEDLRTKQVKVDGLTRQLESLKESKDSLQKEVDAMKEEVSRLEESLKHARKNLNEQVSKDSDELTKFEMYLGLKVEAVDIDLLKFKFVNIDSNDIDKEVWCELFVGDDDYKIGRTFPLLPREQITKIQDDFNARGEFVIFLKVMRCALRDAVE